MEEKTRIAGVVIKNGKLLFLKGKGYEELWVPGGTLEEGETNEECLKREFKEEIGVDITEMKFFKEYDGFSFYRPTQKLNWTVYIVKIDGEIKPDAEIESFLWLSKEDFLKEKYKITAVNENGLMDDLINEKIW